MQKSHTHLICRREAESSECASLLGIDEPVFLRCTKNALRDTSAVSRKLHKIIAEYKPDTIFTPSPLDNDDDHRRTSLALAHSIQGITYKIDIFSYEVWGLCIPNVVVFIDKFIDEKERLINCFKSQIQNNDYAHAFRGLAMYNSLQFGSIQSKYVERFFVLPSHEFINFTNKVLADE
jgi:N-acetylglucosamine malate deacetylase 1